MMYIKRFIYAFFIVALILGAFTYRYFMPKRVAVFAAYTSYDRVPNYVLTYLKKLKEVAPVIVYVTDNELSDEAKKQIAPFVVHMIAKKHNEYDWGSYKRGYLWFKRNHYLDNAEALIFANDSTFAPVNGSFKPMFKKMESQKELDFWGASQNVYIYAHLQSYFMVFHPNVFNSRLFYEFMTSVQSFADKQFYFLEYEIPFTQAFYLHGYKWSSYLPPVFEALKKTYPDACKDGEDECRYTYAKKYEVVYNSSFEDPFLFPLTWVDKYQFPFLKRRVFDEKVFPALEKCKPLLSYIEQNNSTMYQDILAYFKPIEPCDVRPY